MKSFKAKDGYVFVMKDKSQVFGELIYTPDTFDKSSIVEVTKEEAEAIQKELEEKAMQQMNAL